MADNVEPMSCFAMRLSQHEGFAGIHDNIEDDILEAALSKFHCLDLSDGKDDRYFIVGSPMEICDRILSPETFNLAARRDYYGPIGAPNYGCLWDFYIQYRNHEKMVSEMYKHFVSSDVLIPLRCNDYPLKVRCLASLMMDSEAIEIVWNHIEEYNVLVSEDLSDVRVVKKGRDWTNILNPDDIDYDSVMRGQELDDWPFPLYLLDHQLSEDYYRPVGYVTEDKETSVLRRMFQDHNLKSLDDIKHHATHDIAFATLLHRAFAERGVKKFVLMNTHIDIYQ